MRIRTRDCWYKELFHSPLGNCGLPFCSRVPIFVPSPGEQLPGVRARPVGIADSSLFSGKKITRSCCFTSDHGKRSTDSPARKPATDASATNSIAAPLITSISCCYDLATDNAIVKAASPTFTEPIANVTVFMGREAAITCSLKELGKYQVRAVPNRQHADPRQKNQTSIQ